MTFVIPDHRSRTSITLSRHHKGKKVSVTIQTNRARTIELGPSVYAEALDELVRAGVLRVKPAE